MIFNVCWTWFELTWASLLEAVICTGPIFGGPGIPRLVDVRIHAPLYVCSCRANNALAANDWSSTGDSFLAGSLLWVQTDIRACLCSSLDIFHILIKKKNIISHFTTKAEQFVFYYFPLTFQKLVLTLPCKLLPLCCKNNIRRHNIRRHNQH